MDPVFRKAAYDTEKLMRQSISEGNIQVLGLHIQLSMLCINSCAVSLFHTFLMGFLYGKRAVSGAGPQQEPERN